MRIRSVSESASFNAHRMRIDRVHIVLLKYALALIVHVIYTFPGDATGSKKMAYVEAMVALALVLWLNYVRLYLKHRTNRSRRDIE